MRWPFRRGASGHAAPRVRRSAASLGARDAAGAVGESRAPAAEPFACSSCGRTDLPETGGWDPPICLECDAQLNFDGEELEDW